ncbi:hypothetical protein K4L44_00350 [Halosquirtibacter laminarini]|uniref:Uncharacterized protein n=1 Tax=Halosquirtibacter laminarini TaxID=3374600 RepID=A0AC61NFK8_9BACT|nr:hypothetical protein K4L44_00350 [Prolixibacteraceae bacterium]
MIDVYGWGERILKNAMRYLSKEIPSSITPFLEISETSSAHWYHYIIGVLLIGFVVYGLISLEFRYRLLLVGYLSGQFAIQLLWPSVWFGVRFMIPIVPILQFLTAWGIFNLIFKANKDKKNQANTIPRVIFLSLLLFINLPSVKQMGKNSNGKWPQKYIDYFTLAKWCDKTLPKDAVIACRKPALFYLYSKRTVTYFKDTVDDDLLLNDLKNKNTSYIVVDRLGYTSTSRYLVPALKKNKDKVDQVCHIGKPPTFLVRLK